MQRLLSIFPKALLVLLLVFGFLFVGAAPTYAISFGEIVGVVGSFVVGGLPGAALQLFTDFGPADLLGGVVGGVASGIAASIIKLAAALVNSLIVLITLTLFKVGGGLIAAALVFNSKIPAVAETGYSVTLGLANMGFIVALVVIAFATMLRQDNFGYKKALPRVIIAALLVNFGFFIVTKWIIAPVDSVTTAISNASDLSGNALGQIFKPDQLFEEWQSFSGFTNITDNIGDIAGSIMSVLLAAIFSFVGIIAIFALAIMLFIRGIALSILVILLPIAWVMWIFPNLKLPGGGNPWSMWWEQFTKWLLFAPFAMFFLWLSISLANKGELFPDGGLYAAMGQMIVTSGLILGGLLVSNKMGIMGAGIALGAVAAGKFWAKGKVRTLTDKYGGRALDATAKVPKTLQGVGAKWDQYGRLGRLGRFSTGWIRAGGRAGITARTQAQARYQEALKKKFDKLPPFAVAGMLSGLSDDDFKVALQTLTDKNYQWEPKEWIDTIARLQRTGKLEAEGGFLKLPLTLQDRGIFTEPIARIQELQEQGLSFEDMKADEGLKRLFDDAVKVLGYKNLPNIDMRILSGEFRGFPGWQNKDNPGEYAEFYAGQVMDAGLRNFPGVSGSMLAKSRGTGAPFIVKKVEEHREEFDKTYIEPSEIQTAIASGIQGEINEIRADKTISDQVRDQRLDQKLSELQRSQNLSLATQSDREQWIRQNWEKTIKGRVPEQTADQVIARLNGLYAGGAKTFWFPFSPAEGGAAPV